MSIRCSHCGEPNDDSSCVCRLCKKSLLSDQHDSLADVCEATSVNNRFLSVIPDESEATEPLLALAEMKSERRGNTLCPAEEHAVIKWPILIRKPGILGREGDLTPEYFSDDMFIARRQCSIIFQDGVWKIAKIKSDTGRDWDTPVLHNDTSLPTDFPIELHEGDRLQIVDKLFMVYIRGKVVQEQATVSTMKKHQSWFVKCPICGKEYPVASADSRVDVCLICEAEDPFRKRDIATAKARLRMENAN